MADCALNMEQNSRGPKRSANKMSQVLTKYRNVRFWIGEDILPIDFFVCLVVCFVLDQHRFFQQSSYF